MPSEEVNETKEEVAAADTVDTKTIEETKVDPGLKDELSGFDGSQLLLGLMSDPDVQMILNARREGKPTRVTVDADETKPDETVINDEFDDLDDDVKKVVGLLEKKISPLIKDIADLKNLASEYERQGVNSQISQIESKHTDFPKYRKEMAKLAREVPGLGIEELYLVAKSRAGDLAVPEPQTHSEKPTPTPRSRLNKDIKSDSVTGRRGFRNTLSKALDGLDIPS